MDGTVNAQKYVKIFHAMPDKNRGDFREMDNNAPVQRAPIIENFKCDRVTCSLPGPASC